VQPHAALCPTVSDLATSLGRAPLPPHFPWLRTPPPYMGGLRCHHASRDSGPRLPAREGFEASMRPMTLDPASPLVRALSLPRVSQLSVEDELRSIWL
jgi:hypothetical protein